MSVDQQRMRWNFRGAAQAIYIFLPTYKFNETRYALYCLHLTHMRIHIMYLCENWGRCCRRRTRDWFSGTTLTSPPISIHKFAEMNRRPTESDRNGFNSPGGSATTACLYLFLIIILSDCSSFLEIHINTHTHIRKYNTCVHVCWSFHFAGLKIENFRPNFSASLLLIYPIIFVCIILHFSI